MTTCSEPQKGSLGHHLGAFFNSGKLCDVTFLVGPSKERISAHRIILAARSEVFCAMLFGSMQEANTKNEITITDIELPVFKKLLSFIYSDYVSVGPDDVLPMLYCAKKYNLPLLMDICVDFFNNKHNNGNWDDETTCIVLEHAQLFEDTEVLEKAVQSVGAQADTQLMTSRIINLPAYVLKKIVHSPTLSVKSELTVINACIAWAQNACQKNNMDNNVENRRKLLEDVLPYFRLTCLGSDEIFSVVRPSGILNSEDLLDLLELNHTRKLTDKLMKFAAPNNMVYVAGFGWWHVLMKAASGKTFEYNSQYWTTDNVLNPNDCSLEFQDAKFSTFNNLEVQELLIVAENKRHVRLRLPCKKTLLACFQENETIPLEYISGSRTPSILAGHDTNFRYYDPVWRIQSASTFNAMVRIGGWYQASWGQYGSDQGNFPCSAEWAGIGLLDQAWSPFVHAAKSFGIRSAHDGVAHGGNCSLGIIIYGRQ